MGTGLGYAYYIDSVLVDIEGDQYYPAGKKLDQLDDLCDDIDGNFLEINIDENGEIIVTNILGHKFVDLGLPSGLKWAAYNVGAQSPEEYGDYFAWGEVNPKSAYTGAPSLDYASYYYFVDENQGICSNKDRYHGFTIRAVSN